MIVERTFNLPFLVLVMNGAKPPPLGCISSADEAIVMLCVHSTLYREHSQPNGPHQPALVDDKQLRVSSKAITLNE